LQPTVDIEIISLAIVLKEGCPENIVSKIDFNPGCNQQQIIFPVGLWKFQSGILNTHDKIAKRLKSVRCSNFISKDIPVQESSNFNIGFEIQFFSAVGIVCITN
jgi:hypothetical protein